MSSTNQNERFRQLTIRWVLLVLPTLLVGYLSLRFLNFSYTAFTTGIVTQTIYFGLGLLAAYTLYYYGARWVITVIILWAVYMLMERIISRLPGEFDVFYTTARFQLYSTLFLFGWTFGLLLARVRLAYLLIFGVYAAMTIVAISDTVDISIGYIISHLIPVVAYGLYMMFITPQLSERMDITRPKAIRLAGRFGLFILFILLAFLATQYLFQGNLQAVEKELAARGSKKNDGGKGEGKDKKDDGYDDRYGLMDKGDDGYRLKDTMRVNTKMSSSDKLMFCAKLDSYFPDGKTPMPLYFVYHYLTKYDRAKESFTRDVNVPYLDEFDVDPTALPMYYSITDTSMIRKSLGWNLRKVVDAQVYLSENTWKHSVLGPANVFAITTIPVEKDFQKTFLAAYKLKSYISELNNAYFVYNISSNPQLEGFQEQRHEALRLVENFEGIDTAFVNYYTQMPRGGIYDSIAKLADGLIGKDKPPVDKVLAVRDFFLRRNENGKRIFRYTLKPGAVDDPNIPSSKMLYNFLFKTHAGYCTYYAGASLFMLRSLGIPARFTTGFATVNRSDKNKGWYWFYASQAHAWTQVYFPGFGWMDFDMTIGNEDQQSAPKPDGTPPLPPPEPWLVLNARADETDSIKKFIQSSFKELIFQDKPFGLKEPGQLRLDASQSRVVLNDKDTTFAVLKPGDSIIVIAYKDESKQLPRVQAGVPIEQQLRNFPNPVHVDEIHVRKKEKEKKQEDGKGTTAETKEPTLTWQQIAVITAKAIGVLLLMILLLPLAYLIYRKLRTSLTSDPLRKADQVYRTVLYQLHMSGLERDAATPLEYATQQVDPVLHIGFEDFMRMYLRLKYAGQGIQPGDLELIQSTYVKTGPAIRQHLGIGKTILTYFNLLLAARFLQRPAPPEYETSTL
ncbi:MAG: transglutaminase-like domain-containing protein [Cyclobacteriaceae bacterium]|nr:transglutaminase-like domain-containing protein [Cyclobacteriaceae bacterium]